MKFRTIDHMHSDILHNLWKVPADVDLIVGVPRSGMLAASMIALLLNRPLVDLDGFIEGRVFMTGSTRRRAGAEMKPIHALVVDDSTHSGAAMLEVQRKINVRGQALPKVTTCVIYGTSTTNASVDIVFEVVESPRIFEWNVMHHPKILAHACLDIDGVLCHDPTRDENDDGERYREFLASAKPLYLPSHRIHALVTSRLEKYREPTEKWLSENGILYDHLIMLDLPSAVERRRLGSHAAHKAKYYAQSNSTLFIESELLQARTIAVASGKPVLSLEGPEMVLPNSLSPIAIRQKLTNLRILARWLRSFLGDRAVDRLRDIYLRVWSRP